MATTRLNLVPSKYLEVAQTTQYTSNVIQGNTVRTSIDKCTVVNTSNTAATFNLYLVNDDSSPSDENLLIDERRVEPGEFYDCPEILSQILSEGQSISTTASIGNALSLRISGREIIT